MCIYRTCFSNDDLVCLPGFHSYGGSCYFLSPIKSTWLSASNICSIKRNSSLVTFETNDELDFVVEKLLKPSYVNQAFIGLYASDIGQWRWLDGRTFWDSIFGPLFYVYRPDTSHCGLINLVNRSKVAIEGRDCLNDARFICKYGKKEKKIPGPLCRSSLGRVSLSFKKLAPSSNISARDRL
jgi:hypothetical protein